MNVLISAFNCSPVSGSEQYLGWSTAVVTAENGYETYVVTISKTKNEIEKYMHSIQEQNWKEKLHMIYVDIPSNLWKIKGRFGMQIRYSFFQKKVAEIGIRLEKKMEFYYCHHVSWASIVQKIELYKLKAPLVIGPVGGGECTPRELIKNYSMKNRIIEYIRSFMAGMVKKSGWFKQCCNKAVLIFVVTDETKKLIPEKYHKKVIVQQAISISEKELRRNANINRNISDCLNVVMAGRMLYWKAFDLGIEAVKRLIESGYNNLHLDIYGDGPEKSKLMSKYANLIEKGYVTFRGNVTRSGLQNALYDADLCLNTSLHDSGCLVVLEAMANSTPLVCVSTGGPQVLTDNSCAYRVIPTNKEETIQGLAEGVLTFYLDRTLCVKMGNAAYERVVGNFESSVKMKNMQATIRKVLRKCL